MLVVLAVLAVLYACAAALAVRSILHPRDPVNAANAADVLTPLKQDGQLVISTVIAVLAVGVLLIRGWQDPRTSDRVAPTRTEVAGLLGVDRRTVSRANENMGPSRHGSRASPTLRPDAQPRRRVH